MGDIVSYGLHVHEGDVVGGGNLSGGPGGGRSYSYVMDGGRTAGGPVGGGGPPEIRWGWDGCFPGGWYAGSPFIIIPW